MALRGSNSTAARRGGGRLAARAGWMLALAVWLHCASGCGLGNQFLFSATHEFPATPAQYRVPYQEFWFHARDGTVLNGWFTAGSSGKPLVLYFHGNGGNLSDGVQYLTLLHSMGYPVCIFDYRGYGKSGGLVHAERDLYDDARGMLDFLEGEGWRHESMIYYGQSLGAAVALQMALERAPSGLVLESPFTSLADVQKHLSPVAYVLFGWWSFYAKFDNLAKIPRVNVPLLFISGDRDELTPLEMTLRLYSNTQAPKMLYILRGANHCDAAANGGAAYLDAWRRFDRLLSREFTAGTRRP